MPVLLDDVKYFKVITETLNITRASEIIGISQPALSYAIKRLENRLGGSLLVRLKNGVQLTKLRGGPKKLDRMLSYSQKHN